MTEAPRGLTVQRSAGGVAFWVHVTPRSRRPGVGGSQGDALRIAVADAPVSGRANAACTEALAQVLGVPRAAVELDPASRGRRKRVRVAGEASRLEERLRELAGSSTSG